MNFGKADIEAFQMNPVWLHLKAEFSAAVELGRDELERTDSEYTTDFLRGGIQQMRNIINRPDDILAEMQEQEKRGA